MISEHISLSEGVRSITAKRLGLDNTPNEEHLNNMKLLAVKVFEPLRKFVGGPIRINSFVEVQNHNIVMDKQWT